jgi:putative flippase GtrA
LPPATKTPPRRGFLRSFSRSALVSLLTTALDFGILVALVELAGVHYVLATWLGTLVGSLSNFIINRRWSFGATAAPPEPQLARFVPVQAGASALQTGGVWVLTRFAGVTYVGSKLAAAVVVYLIWNYPLNRLFVFRDGRRDQSRSTGSSAAARRLASSLTTPPRLENGSDV